MVAQIYPFDGGIITLLDFNNKSILFLINNKRINYFRNEPLMG